MANCNDMPQTLSGIGTRDHSITPCQLETPESGCYASYEALVIPLDADEVAATDELIGITVDDDAEYVYRLPAEYKDKDLFLGGYVYTFNITVDAKGLEVSVAQSTDWNKGTDGSGSVALP